MVRDADLREKAKEEAKRFLTSGDARTDEHEALFRHVIELWGERFGLAAGA